MSFLSVFSALRGVGKTLLGAEQTIAPIVESLYPPVAPLLEAADPIVKQLIGSVVQKEVANPSSGAGPTKLQGVLGDLNSSLQLFQDVLAKNNQKLIYDTTLATDATSAYVLAFNKTAALKDSFKIVPLTPTPPTQ